MKRIYADEDNATWYAGKERNVARVKVMGRSRLYLFTLLVLTEANLVSRKDVRYFLRLTPHSVCAPSTFKSRTFSRPSTSANSSDSTAARCIRCIFSELSANFICKSTSCSSDYTCCDADCCKITARSVFNGFLYMLRTILVIIEIIAFICVGLLVTGALGQIIADRYYSQQTNQVGVNGSVNSNGSAGPDVARALRNRNRSTYRKRLVRISSQRRSAVSALP